MQILLLYMQLNGRVLKITIILAVAFFWGAGENYAQGKKDHPAKKESAELDWHTDLMKAYELSKKSKKPVFAFFTGSDWCGWCKKLQADVFSKKEFVTWAKKNVILLEVDFPRGKQLNPELMQQNYGLQQSFGVRGYPTIWMFHMTKSDTAKTFGVNAIGSLGYPAGAEPGKEQVKFLQVADSLLILSKKKK